MFDQKKEKILTVYTWNETYDYYKSLTSRSNEIFLVKWALLNQQRVSGELSLNRILTKLNWARKLDIGRDNHF